MFPNDAITISEPISGITSIQITSGGGPNTILAVSMQQENNSSDTTIECGNDAVARNYATNFSVVQMNYQCDDNIIISKTGNDEAFVIVTYVPYFTGDFSTTTEGTIYNPTTDISSSSDIAVYGSISAGEFIISGILLMAILLKCMELLSKGLCSITTERKFLKYNGGDVPIEKE